MTDGLRKSHLRKAHQVGLSEVGLPEDYPFLCLSVSQSVTGVTSQLFFIVQLCKVLDYTNQIFLER